MNWRERRMERQLQVPTQEFARTSVFLWSGCKWKRKLRNNGKNQEDLSIVRCEETMREALRVTPRLQAWGRCQRNLNSKFTDDLGKWYYFKTWKVISLCGYQAQVQDYKNYKTTQITLFFYPVEQECQTIWWPWSRLQGPDPDCRGPSQARPWGHVWVAAWIQGHAAAQSSIWAVWSQDLVPARNQGHVAVQSSDRAMAGSAASQSCIW